jgi:hypothetical protein
MRSLEEPSDKLPCRRALPAASRRVHQEARGRPCPSYVFESPGCRFARASSSSPPNDRSPAPLGGEAERVERRGRFLYTSDCDPGQDAAIVARRLRRSGAVSRRHGSRGSIEFRPAGAVQLGDDAGIIVDACEPNAWDWVSASDSATSIRRTPPPRGERCHGAAAGVESMRVLRYTPQSIASSVDAGLVTANGIVIARDVH